ATQLAQFLNFSISQSRLMLKTLEWTDDGVRFIDQRKLPTEEVFVTCRTYQEEAEAIRNMTVRGAPAIGVAAAMGIALGVRASSAASVDALRREFEHICEVIGATRPTAVNLFWAIRRMRETFARNSHLPVAQLQRHWSPRRSRCIWKTSPQTRQSAAMAPPCCPPTAGCSRIAMPARWPRAATGPRWA